ncbi:hypothetical protein GCM10027046_30170 [Uliginosibacterium flavum]|uniref:Secreted protein n=1 Tax=Uliginosibacterium flavum TaxID=1396831 RepID=A0ABV2TGC8_9RHOO
MIVSVAFVPAIIAVSPEGVKTNVPGVDGVSVIVFVHVAPTGMLSPVSAKPEVPTLKPVEVQGEPTAKADVLFVPAGKGIVRVPPETATPPSLVSVTVKTTEPAGEVTDEVLSEVDTLATPIAAGGVDVLLLSPPPPPPPQALSATTALAIIRG